MELLPLTIFPEGGLAGSIITTVWVGVFVMCFFNLRFGWVLSGLVVPGYLVPLLIVKPIAAMVISFEAILTYLIVWVFSEKIAPGRFPSLFGRDRFMGLILASIAVRLAFDGYLLPEFSGWLEDNFDRRIDWENNLQSFGLVVISLMANQFWKPGLRRGLFMAIVTIGLTYVIIRFGLMEITNFRISGVHYLYEGLSSSILASPKAYMILTLTALIASHYNVKYGWDFSGILIPALLALQWYQPTKIVTSLAEAVIIYCIARAILQLPFMANVTMEGGRKLLLFFNISFAWKMALGWFVIWQGLDVKMTDFFGFGYLLSTLVAIKAHDKDIFPRLARSTLQVSLAGAVLGNFAGLSLSAATARAPWNEAQGQAGQSGISANTQLNALVVNAIGDAHARQLRNVPRPLSAEHRDNLARLVELIEEGIPTLDPRLNQRFDQRVSGWRVTQIEGGRLAIARDDGLGAELLVFDPAAPRDLAIILPDPTETPGLGHAALELQRNQGARWLVLASPQPSSQLSDDGVAQIFMSAADTAHVVISAAPAISVSQFLVSNGAAAQGDVASLRQIVPDLEMELANQAGALRGAHAALRLSEAALLQIAARASDSASPRRVRACRLSRPQDGEMGWRQVEQLAYARFEIAAPMVADVRAGEAPLAAAASARIAGMELTRCRMGSLVHWSLSSSQRREGNIFLAEGEAPAKAILTFENSRSALPARIGASLHQQWSSDALFVATRSDNFLREPHSIFDVVWQEWARSQDAVADPMTFQLRARPRTGEANRRGVDVFVINDRIGPEREAVAELISALRSTGLRAQQVTTEIEYAGMEARPGISVQYLDGLGGRRYATGWLNFPGLLEATEAPATAQDNRDGEAEG